ncbi:MAG: hypothetical protein ACI9ON_002165 [Limisphaerales bacterium]|jgi:hypothetical protein
MTIHNIDMAVPLRQVESKQANAKEDANLMSEVAQEAVELDKLAQEFLGIMRDKNKASWTRRQQQQRAERFELQLKGLIKRFSSGVATVLDDRTSRVRLRTRVYADLMSTLRILVSEHERSSAKKRKFDYLAWMFLGLSISAMVVTLL